MKRPLAMPLLLTACVALSSCAVTTPGLQPARSMPAARAALRPEYRLFYDTLVDYGDWVLIEPLGYVFRPRVDFHTWQPYEAGFWVPSDSYGWVWISSEPYGWATYHYGRWFDDEFQGWVWLPGVDWAPAWVSWQTTDHYVGWAPLGPGSGFRPLDVQAPGGSYLYAEMNQLGATDLALKRASEIGSEAASARPVETGVVVEGVRVPAGPSIERIERATGRSIARVKISDALSRARADSASTTSPVSGRSGPATGPAVSPEDMRRAAAQTASEARGLRARGGSVPSRLLIVRPPGGRDRLRARPAGRDTSRAEPGD